MHFKDEPRIIKLREDVLKYNRLVRDLGLRDHQVCAAAIIFGPRLTCSYEGASRPASELEDAWAVVVSFDAIGDLDCSRLAWCYSKWSYFLNFILYVPEESQR